MTTVPAVRSDGWDAAEHHWRAVTLRTKGLQRGIRARQGVCVGER